MLPFVRQFYGTMSTYLWQDDEGTVHDVQQGKGGKQDDALMPALSALGQHNAVVALQLWLTPQERPERVLPIFQALDFELWVHSRIQIHQGKTQLWNKGGFAKPGWETLAPHAWRSDPDAIVWRRCQGFWYFLGSPEFFQARLLELSASHQRLVDKIPHVSDLLSVCLLLLFCAASRPSYILRVVHPDATREFATLHGTSMRRCLETLQDVRINDETWNVGSLPLSLGGLALRGAVRGRAAAYWSSWEDGLHMTRRRHAPVDSGAVIGPSRSPPRRCAQSQESPRGCRVQRPRLGSAG